MKAQSIGRRAGFALAALVLGLVGTWLLAEIALWATNPTPRVQVIRLNEIPHVEVDGTISFWVDDAEHHELRNASCLEQRPDAPRIAAFGTSILEGVTMRPDEVWSTDLQALLADRGGPCVLNHAMSASHFETQLASARRLLPELEPKVLVFEVWGGALGHFTRVGDSLYSTSDIQVDASGMPNPLRLPAGVNLALYRRSFLYEYAALATATQHIGEGGIGAVWRDFTANRLPELRALAAEHDTELILVLAAPMHEPFEDQLRQRANDENMFAGQQTVVDWARTEGVPLVDLAAIYQGREPTEVSVDPCCHLNREGHRLLAEALAPVVSTELERARPSAPPPAPEPPLE